MTITAAYCNKPLVSSTNIILFSLVIPLSGHFFEGARDGKRQNGSFVLSGHFFLVKKTIEGF